MDGFRSLQPSLGGLEATKAEHFEVWATNFKGVLSLGSLSTRILRLSYLTMMARVVLPGLVSESCSPNQNQLQSSALGARNQPQVGDQIL